MAKRPNKEYVACNQAYLQTIALQSETLSLVGGVLYQIIESGGGTTKPLGNSVVGVHYSGWLIDGHCFDSTLENSYPETFRLREVIEGWQIALNQMVVGDKWRIFIPSQLAYGDRTMDDIPGGSTLIFNVELVSLN